jgi:hypothetical protein
MVAWEKGIWFGGVLAASLFVLALAGCGAASSRLESLHLLI